MVRRRSFFDETFLVPNHFITPLSFGMAICGASALLPAGEPEDEVDPEQTLAGCGTVLGYATGRGALTSRFRQRNRSDGSVPVCNVSCPTPHILRLSLGPSCVSLQLTSPSTTKA